MKHGAKNRSNTRKVLNNNNVHTHTHTHTLLFYSFKSKIIHVLLGFGCPNFICDNKHTFGKQMPPDLAMLRALSIETVD